ncbi:serine/threonine kinase family protein [Plesiocystis pacifica SIR-1]|uniref:Serine/threonine kinase family protein n=1 Tax=Plesiocystis pacifica SIR-1 TaxID=391625 RepID=A6G6A2_9BACT|nr:serine/threonine-protein kinase [Plesiocystis pacifica]EDM78531.1 serine/threonine kinase family protein [Plesiocystis pacifica SIR-1]
MTPSDDATIAGPPLDGAALRSAFSEASEEDVDATLVGEGDDEPNGDAATLRAGEKLGRYSVLGTLGAGAMGVVYAAYDPELDRRVAIKVIRPQKKSGALVQARLLREAQALARLSHPNVVAVHDVGSEADGRVFVAMEFVSGQTLDALDLPSRDWAEAVAIFRAAGRGLAAAHAAGLIHRDFKPTNVMRREDGRVIVLDFGLARAARERGADESSADDAPRLDPEPPPDFQQLEASSTFDAQLTRTGSLLGTPAYMAPELYGGGSATPLSDQFAFCVAVYEALYGERPFRGESLASIYFNMAQDQVAPAPPNSTVPTSLRAALLRGLASKPEARWPTMDALLEALGADPRRRRRTLVSALASVAALVAVGVGAFTIGSQRGEPTDQAPAVCTGGRAQMEAVWSEATRAELEAAIAGVDLPYAATTAPRVAARLDAYAEDWIAMHRDACEATRVRKEQSEQLLDLRMACLDRRKQELGGIAELLAEPDAALVERALSAAGGLSDIEACADLDALSSVAPPPAAGPVRERVDTVRRAIDRGRAMRLAGHNDEAKALAVEARAALPPEYPPVAAELDHFEGDVLIRLGDYDGARERLERAQLGALRHRDLHRASQALASQAFLVGYLQGENAVGHGYADQAIALAHATGDPELLSVAQGQKGVLFHAREELEPAQRWYELAIENLPEDSSSHRTQLADRLYNLALVRRGLGHTREALADLRRAEALYLDEHGSEDHPAVIDARDAVAVTLFAMDRYEEAEGALQTVLSARERDLEPDHPDLFNTLNSLANVRFALGRHEQARPPLERALDIARASFQDHAFLAMALVLAADVELEVGAHAKVRALLEESDAVHRVSMGEDSPRVVDGLLRLAALDLAEAGALTPGARRSGSGGSARALPLGPEIDAAGVERAARDLAEAEAVFARLSAQPEFRNDDLQGRVFAQRGELACARGQTELARTQLQTALTRMAAAHGEDSVAHARVAASLGRASLAAQDPAAAVEALASAVEVFEAKAYDTLPAVQARELLARAYLLRADLPGAAPLDRARVRALLDHAKARYAGAGREADALRVERTLAALPR